MNCKLKIKEKNYCFHKTKQNEIKLTFLKNC